MSPDEAADLLGVLDAGDSVEVRRRWRAAARLHHPDAGGDAAAFARLRLAYDTLADDETTDPWPDPAELPVGARWVEVGDGDGIAWRALVVADAMGEASLFTRLERGRLETLVIDPGPLAVAAGAWSSAPRGAAFDDAVARWCRSERSIECWVAALPRLGVPASRWAMRELDQMCETAGLRPDVETMRAVAQRLEAGPLGPDQGHDDRFRVALGFAVAVTRALQRTEPVQIVVGT